MRGGEVILKIPSGTSAGDQLKLKGKGMCKMRTSIRGDMFVHIDIAVPKELNSEQKKLLEDLEKSFMESANKGNSFFQKVKGLWS